MVNKLNSRVLVFLCFLGAVALASTARAQTIRSQKIRPVRYPYPVRFLNLQIEGQAAHMAYMDARPSKPNGRAVILFHGKNFNGYYWKDVAARLTKAGFRVVIPDQIGWGKSSKPRVHYSFHLLAANSKRLLDALKIQKVVVIGHSLGGMLATRFTLLYPATVEKLVLENPLGLEDYRLFVPPASFETLLKGEKTQTYASLKKYQGSYYPNSEWKPEYEQYVQAQAESLIRADYAQATVANALTSLMVYEQPVVYEFNRIKVPTLLIIGQNDRTVLGKNRLPTAQQNKSKIEYSIRVKVKV